jgi:hypothetical protein
MKSLVEEAGKEGSTGALPLKVAETSDLPERSCAAYL